ncbi:MAG: U32 family peptidase [Lachnospiraceae bacterium]|nr:U32 family peptidase [Lachnospiraceae bacterium]
MKKPELLVPAGSPEVLKTAVRYGADAVYIGGEAFSLREKARNATAEELEACVRFAHERGVKVYVTANILAHNRDLDEARAYFETLKKAGPDGLIISDPGIFMTAREVMPECPVHISTQANNVNYGTYRFWYAHGVRRVVAGRELSLPEIAEIRARIPDDMEIEAFVHGAMCVSYSGRCLLSNYLTGRDANHGACTHPCRWRYALVEETRPGEYMPIEENERGSFLFSAKDLCMVGHIPDLLEAGIDAFKIEGRMKTALYVATAARAYRNAIDDYCRDPARYRARIPHYEREVRLGTNRAFSTGFFYGKPSAEDHIYTGEAYRTEAVFIGCVLENDGEGYTVFSQKNRFFRGDTLEILKPDGENVPCEVLEIRGAGGEAADSAPHAGERLRVRLSAAPEPGDILRKTV